MTPPNRERPYVIDDLLPGWRYKISYIPGYACGHRNVLELHDAFSSMRADPDGQGLLLIFRSGVIIPSLDVVSIDLVRPADDDCALLVDD